METKPFSLQSPEQIAKDYSGNKQQIAQAAQVGLLDPTAAVLAGMFIDRMRSAQMEEQAPNQTVAQEVFMPQQPQMGMGAAPGMAPPMGQPMQQPIPQGAPQMGAGMDALPVPNDMFAGPGMASGGLVAFSSAGSVRDRELEELRRMDEERMRGNRLFTGSGTYQRPDLVDRPPPPSRPPLPLQGSSPFLEEITVEAMMPDSDATASELEDQGLGLPTDVPTTRKPADERPAGERPAGERTSRAAAQPSEPQVTKEEESALDRYTQMLLGGMQDRNASREEARNMALLQAGLGIMGGQSPYALQNIAQGALPATQAYQQQMAQARKEERETIGELANIEMKAKELGLTEKRYKDLMTIAGMQIAASGASDSTKLRSDIVRLATEVMKSETALGMPASIQEAIQQATMALTGQAPSGAPQTQTIPFANLGK
jgi:hypothetical protein